MNVTTAISQVSTINTKFESIFTQLDSFFPQLLSRNERTTLNHLKTTVSSIASGYSSNESEGTASFSAKYSPIFDKLNEKIKDLSSIDKMIAEIKEDSEQMELIALNAMVISVKSGEKGLAFSRITENLQRLSKDMFLYSDKLNEEEAALLEQINSLKGIFSGIIDTQRSISSKDSECASDIQHMLSNLSPALSQLDSEVLALFPLIERSMSVLQEKSLLARDFQSVSAALNELNRHNPPYSGSEDELDYACFAISVYEKVCGLISKINSEVSRVCGDFAENWQQVIESLDKADSSRMDFESHFLNNHAFGNNNIQKQLSSIINKYETMTEEFSSYHLVQKDLQGICQNITTHAKTIYSVFESLRPVMSRLHHVRILQQIEVSKNDAIKSVQDSVTDMDNLINSANKSLDEMQSVLESFIHDTSNMLSNFTRSIETDNEKMISFRNEKELFLGDLRNGKITVDSAFQNFTVFPNDFQKKCVVVQQNLQEFMRLNMELGSIMSDFENEKSVLIGKKTSLMNSKGLQSWEITNRRYLDSLANIR